MSRHRVFNFQKIDWMHFAVALSPFLSGTMCSVQMDVAAARFHQKQTLRIFSTKQGRELLHGRCWNVPWRSRWAREHLFVESEGMRCWKMDFFKNVAYLFIWTEPGWLLIPASSLKLTFPSTSFVFSIQFMYSFFHMHCTHRSFSTESYTKTNQTERAKKKKNKKVCL